AFDAGDAIIPGDYDGDGRTDLAAYHASLSSLAANEVGLATHSARSDLVETLANGFGATFTLAYAESSAWPTSATLPFLFSTVKTATITDGRGNSAQTTYAYQGAAYDRAEKRFLGFRNVT